jgi:hypothetical protein
MDVYLNWLEEPAYIRLVGGSSPSTSTTPPEAWRKTATPREQTRIKA